MLVSGIVLAGGQSRRFGSPKERILIGGQTLLARTQHLLAEALGTQPMPVLPDFRPGHGPLAGVETALREALVDRVLVVACDLPGLSVELLRRIAEWPVDADVVLPLASGRRQPLCARWHRRCLPAIRAALDAGQRSIQRLLETVDLAELSPADLGIPVDRQLFNVNRPEDLAKFLA